MKVLKLTLELTPEKFERLQILLDADTLDVADQQTLARLVHLNVTTREEVDYTA